MSIDKSKYLQDTLDSYKMKHIPSEVDAFKSKRDEITNALEDHYGSKQYDCFNSGSFAKHTAINIKYDMDVVAPFKKDSFDTLNEMFDDVYDFLSDEYSDAEEVRKQKVSIGVFFKEEDGIKVQIDVVPGRELQQDNYKNDKSLNLFKNDGDTTWQKTNISDQIEHIKGKTDERKVIRLLKIWKKNHNKDYKSFMLELFSIKALKGYSGANDLWEKLKYTMEYIRDNVSDVDFKLLDPGNSNNNVLESMSTIKRSSLKSDMRSMLCNIENNESFLKVYFPVNKLYYKEEERENYGTGAVSYPPSGKRFG